MSGGSTVSVSVASGLLADVDCKIGNRCRSGLEETWIGSRDILLKEVKE